MNIHTKVKLNNGTLMPILGLGVFRSQEETVQAVKNALSVGYRHIDTATRYRNEAFVGQAIRESGIPREELFVTTKLWNDAQRNHTQQEAFEYSMKELDIGYIDLYMVHWPVADHYHETWKFLEEIYMEGRVKAIGVCNFEIDQLKDLMSCCRIIPAVNQIEIHPLHTRKKLIAFCQDNGIACEAWSPLGAGTLLNHPILESIAENHHKTTAQIMLRWDIQQGLITIPKSTNPERIKSNSEIFDFSLSCDDMAVIDALNQNKFNSVTGADSHNVTF